MADDGLSNSASVHIIGPLGPTRWLTQISVVSFLINNLSTVLPALSAAAKDSHGNRLQSKWPLQAILQVTNNSWIANFTSSTNSIGEVI
jgi:hypothetical protein